MKRPVFQLLMLLVLVSILGSRAIHAQESGAKAAHTSAESWLSLIDNKDYAAS